MRPSLPRRVAALMLAGAVAVGLAPAAGADPAGDPAKVTQSGPADPGEYPAQVALLNPANAANSAFCGGTHVLPGWVLTAAHCVDFGEGTLETPDVLLGTTSLVQGGQRISVTETIVHPLWDLEAFVNDIALLRLATPAVDVPFQALVVPGLEFLQDDGPAVVTGWGGLTSDQENQEFPVDLQEAVVPMVDDVTCDTRLAAFGPGQTMTDPATQVCAGIGTMGAPEEADACQGDSGGPLLRGGPAGTRQVGIVSYGPTCGLSPTVYTGVVDFIDFIEATTGQQVAAFPDIPGDTHEANIERIAFFAVTAGDNTGRYNPGTVVNRGQMATFIGRSLGLDEIPDENSFSDIDGNAHQGFINALAAAGIAGGFGDGTFRPNENVNRGQMAAFIVRALALAPVAAGPFSDIAGSTHEGAINALADAGIAGGFPDGTYRPASPVFRGQMATFLARGFFEAPLG